MALPGGGAAPEERALVPLLGRLRDGPPQARRAGDGPPAGARQVRPAARILPAARSTTDARSACIPRLAQWTVVGVIGLRKKTEGPGRMCSGFVDEFRGFGLPLTADELAKVNAWRAARYGGLKTPLAGSPGVRFLDNGKNKEGYWTYEHFREQVEDVLDVIECLYPHFQVVIEVDWSSGHARHRDGALSANSMNVGIGGKQPIPHDSMMTAGCLGPHDPKLKEGDFQRFAFGPNERSHFHTERTDLVGVAKGMKQVLWERGLYVTGMVEKVPDDDLHRDQSLSMTHALSQCEDFRNEVTALQEILSRRGHILVMTPKGHCELAGEGIEYCWGKMKKHFRKHNRCNLKGFNQLIIDSMSRAALPLRTARKFARRARTYERVYADEAVRELVDIERIVKQYKSHHNAVDFAGSFIDGA